HADQFNAGRLIEQLNRLPAMRPLAANPLLLSIVCFVVDDPNRKVELPTTRGELCDRTVDRMLAWRGGTQTTYPGREKGLPRIRKRRLLERAALRLLAGLDLQERKLTFDEATLLDALERAVLIEGLASPEDIADVFRDDLLQNSGLIRGDDDSD